MEKRKLGTTQTALSVVGFAGIIVMNETPKNAERFVAEAVERGVNYFDVAPSYGNAQERLGPALAPYRSRVFLACKTQERSAKGAQAELEESLRLLRTDMIDLYQLHAMTTVEEVDQVFRRGGAIETLLLARDRGIVRHLGFSAHSEQAAVTLLERFPFDSMLFPVNWVTWFQGGFGAEAVRKAVERGTGVLALKSLAKRRIEEGEARSWEKAWYHPVESYEEARRALRFTLSQPVTAAVSPGHIELFRWVCDAAEEFTPMSDHEMTELSHESAGLGPIFRT